MFGRRKNDGLGRSEVEVAAPPKQVALVAVVCGAGTASLILERPFSGSFRRFERVEAGVSQETGNQDRFGINFRLDGAQD